MFAGALLQTVLAIIPLPGQVTAVERSVLSTVYQKLADYALDPSSEQSVQQARDALLKAHSTLSDSNIQSPQGKMFFALLEEAYLLDNPSRHALPQITAFTATVDEALHLLARAIREKQPVKTLPNLEEALRDLEHSEKSANRTRNAASTDLRFVIS